LGAGIAWLLIGLYFGYSPMIWGGIVTIILSFFFQSMEKRGGNNGQ